MMLKSNQNLKFKLAYRSDIRRLKNQITGIDSLRQTTKSIYGREIDSDQQKYYYYDSDDDRIDISDDEDLNSAIQACRKNSLKIHVENYDPKNDSFFKSNLNSERADVQTGPSTVNSNKEANRFSKLMQSTKSVDDSLSSDEEEGEGAPNPFNEVQDADSTGEEEFQLELEKELGEITNNSSEEKKISQRKNTAITDRKYDLLEEKECKVSSRSIPRG